MGEAPSSLRCYRHVWRVGGENKARGEGEREGGPLDEDEDEREGDSGPGRGQARGKGEQTTIPVSFA